MADSITDCIFCQIVAGTTQADIVLDTPDTLFFRDISPKAAVHVVGIPKKHLPALSTVTAADQPLLGTLVLDAAEAARSVGIAEGGYRLITNVGSDAGQEVSHLHFHILGGEPLGSLRGN